MTTSLIKQRDLDPSLLSLIESSGGTKLIPYTIPITATEEGQTVFDTGLRSLDANNDAVMVQHGGLLLFPNEHFTISGTNIVVNDGWALGDTGGIYVYKNVPKVDGEEFISGSLIEEGSIPLSKLEEMPEVNVTSDVPIHLSIDADGGLVITYDDGVGEA